MANIQKNLGFYKLFINDCDVVINLFAWEHEHDGAKDESIS